MTRVGALLFDLDGTLVHSDPLHFAVFQELLGEYGIELDWETFQTKISGRTNELVLPDFLPELAAEHAAIGDRKEAMFRARLSARVDPMPGIETLLDRAEAEGIRVAVVTNAPRENAVAMLAATGLAPRFPLVIAGGDAAWPKPNPAPYRLAMVKLGLTPEFSVVFEDSLAGLAAGRASGAHVFGLASSLDPDALLAAGAHVAITDFNDPALHAHLDQAKVRTT
ncbi:HAD family phosphatase [Rhodobacteraceae bacterium DSL-40]|uniref:HAD family hydrolase n=1 Tax=Amaricoccus sp. B4 TaxID=3368557 RepID=UPI000DADC9A9